jgi:superfamily II DNA or RNA helicase
MNKTRNELQQEVVEKYIREGPPKRATLVLGTGIGKSKVAIDILTALKKDKVYIIVNSTDLRDTTWENEFNEWGLSFYFKQCVKMVTYQTVYKWKKEEVDLSDHFIIADEVDFAANVPEYSKFFYEYSDCTILGLTGFITGNKREWFDENLPVFVEYSIGDAQEEGILNKMHFIFIKYLISSVKDRLVEYKKDGQTKHFKTSENDSYIYSTNAVDKAQYALDQFKQDMASGMSSMSQEKYNTTVKVLEAKVQQTLFNRNRLLGSLSSSIFMTKRILSELPENSKTVVFSTVTEQSSKIVDFVYNSKQSDAENSEIFSKFNSGKINTIGVCSKIDRGVNVPNLNTAIFESFYGSDTKAIQRLGRLARLKVNEVAQVYILLPHYLEHNALEDKYEIKETRQVEWARRMLKETKVDSYEIKSYMHDS